ncbi:MAG: hypothetical protein NC094_12040 [Bacteroidales bacterium]|nr:hypothetical protein [Lachnoclostridium sp.]MCM1385274.1 hypothetical protein [Lachnoclostridium sp.]MCM1466140.1 hypothetical protein [Bacteroidales bacterium]
MSDYTCRTCGATCDPVELVGGVCLECMEEERQRQIRASSVARMLNSPSRQMALDLEGMKNAVPD